MSQTTAKPFVWSFSSLETFEQCPRKFYHRHILKDPEPSSPALEKGRADHKALEDYMLNRRPDAIYPIAEAVKRQAQGKKLFIELKAGVTGDIEACGFFDNGKVWGRSVFDVLIADYPNAVIVDWKTGKNREGGKYDKGPKQLEMMTAFAFAHFPKIEKITAFNIYVETAEVGRRVEFKRSEAAKLWTMIIPSVQRVDKAIADNSYPMMPGPLCGYCSVLTCPNNRS